MRIRRANTTAQAVNFLASGEFDAIAVRAERGEPVLIIFINGNVREKTQREIGGSLNADYENYPSLSSRAQNLLKRLERIAV